jgi:hypothetical protein
LRNSLVVFVLLGAAVIALYVAWRMGAAPVDPEIPARPR